MRVARSRVLSLFLTTKLLQLFKYGVAESVHGCLLALSSDAGIQPLVEQQDRQAMHHGPAKDGPCANAFWLAHAGRKPRHFLL